MSRIIKSSQLADRVLEYGFTKTFDDIVLREKKKEGKTKEHHQETADELQQTADIFETAVKKAEEIRKKAEEEAERIYTSAKMEAEKLSKEAAQEAERLCNEAKEDGYKTGYDSGFEDGYNKAYSEHKAEMDDLRKEFQKTIKDTIEIVVDEKNKILEKYIDDLKKVTLTIAEKVIQTSLKSSGEVIKRMIVAAAGKLKKTQWVKIYVSQKDAGMMIQGDAGLLNELAHISGNIKIIAMDHAEDGSCIIELPEEIIDVSVNTQLENIKGILNNARL